MDAPERVHGSRQLVAHGRNAPRGYRCTCDECGDAYEALSPSSDFCSAMCRTAFNNRRRVRGAEMYDLVMALRYERGISKLLGVWSVLCRMAAAFREEDRAERAGRKSWRGPRGVLQRHPDVVAQIVRRAPR